MPGMSAGGQAASWGQGYVGMEVARNSISDGGESLGKRGARVLKKRNLYQEPIEREQVVSQLLVLRFGDLEVDLWLQNQREKFTFPD